MTSRHDHISRGYHRWLCDTRYRPPQPHGDGYATQIRDAIIALELLQSGAHEAHPTVRSLIVESISRARDELGSALTMESARIGHTALATTESPTVCPWCGGSGRTISTAREPVVCRLCDGEGLRRAGAS